MTIRHAERVVSEDQRVGYREKGYLLVERVAPESFLDGVQRVLEDLVEDRIAEWQRTELLVDRYADLDFGLRYFRAWLAAGSPAGAATAHGEAFIAALGEYAEQTWLTDLVCDLVEVDLTTPLQSSCYRAKFPDDESTSLPWHQDAQCIAPAFGVDFVTAWIPLSDVSEVNSCLEVSPTAEEKLFEVAYSARSGYVSMKQSDCDRLTGTRAIHMKRGDVLIISPFLPHRSLDNTSTQIRWSLDLRYSSA